MAEANARVGLKADGTPCLRCQKTEGGFCYQHLDQADQHQQTARPAVVASVTLANNPQSKAAAADELPVRRVGLKKDGTPCLNCAKTASGFCGQHLDQAEGMVTVCTQPKVAVASAPPAAKQPTSSATSSTIVPTKVGLKKDGTPCSKCAAAAGGFCHLHLDQADSAPTKAAAVKEPAVMTATRAGAATGSTGPKAAAGGAPSQGLEQTGGKSDPPKGAKGQAGTLGPELEDSSDEEEEGGADEEDLEDVEHVTLVLGNKYPKFRRDIKKESLQAETWLPKKALHISNVNHSGRDRNNWLEFWAGKTGRDRSLQQCAKADCLACEARGDSMVGGHVWMQGQMGVRHCFIVPICESHNTSRKYDYPNWFQTKSDIALVRITTRRKFVRGRCKPGEKRICRFEMREREE